MTSNLLVSNIEKASHKKAIVFLVLTALLWSMGGLLIKLVTWNPIAIAGGRSAIAALMMLVVIRKPKMKFSFNLLCGAIMYAGTVILFVASNKMTTAANAILLQYTAPIYIALFGAWILKEKTKLLDWITIVIVLGGMFLFFIDELSQGNLWGNIIAILSGVSFAFLIIFMRKQKDESPIESVFWGNVLTAIIGLPFMVTSGMPDNSSLMGLLLLGVFQLGLSYILYSSAIKHVSALEAVLVPIIEPIFNPVWVLLVVGEKPGKWALVGGLIVIAAIAFRGVIYALKPGIIPVVQREI